MVAVNRKKVNSEGAVKKPEKTKKKVVSDGLNRSIKKKDAKKPKVNRGLMLIKNLPHGFFEEQLKEYFSQFGKVTRVRLARSRKTTRSRGYAFIEFQYPEIAEIASETMNNYMMFKKVLKTVCIPPTEQKFNYFRSSVLYQTKEDGVPVLTSRFLINRDKKIERYNRELTAEEQKKRQAQTKKKIQKLKKKLQKHNIDYDIDGVVPSSSKAETSMEQPKSESEADESDSDIDDSIEPQNFGFVDESGNSEDEKHELDSDVSEDPSPKIAKQKKQKSILAAKEVVKNLLKPPKVEKKKKSKEIVEESPVVEKKNRKKLVGISKKTKKGPKVEHQPAPRVTRALKDAVSTSNQIKVVKMKDIKKKKVGKK